MSEISNNDASGAKPRPVLALQPGILVGLKTEERGGTRRESERQAAPSIDEIGAVLPAGADETARVERRETTTVTLDPEEYKRALEARNAARGRITKICTLTPFGLLCPRSREGELDAAIGEAERLVREFNQGARFSRVDVFAIKGYIADNDEKAARGIANEIAELLASMKAGVEARDPEAIRAACRKAQALQSMIDEQAGERVSVALAAARSSAREIAKTIKDKGHANVIMVTDGNKRILDELRASFAVIDLPGEGETAPSGEPLAPVATAEIDIDLPPLDFGGVGEAAPIASVPIDVGDDGGEDFDAGAAPVADPIGELAAGAPDDAPAFDL